MIHSIFRNSFLAVFFVLFSAVLAQAACPAPLQGSAYDRQINSGSINQDLFNRAVLYYTNKIRCRRGLPLFNSTRDVIGAANTQARNMTRTRTYSHNLNVAGARDLRERMRAQTRNFRSAGENIAKNFVYILNGRPYIPAENCAFRYLATRQPVPIHTYRSLAQELVKSWETSRDHLTNIINRRYTRMGAAFGIDRRGQLCGEVYASQVFAG
ncbi:MAG: hypothetical protein COB08_000460 [Rhodobacteraceae bacterium]|nr:hypothetical protein [Paracoccaceae bacterium]